MADDNKIFVSVRLNTNNPEHVRIQKVLTNLNSRIYKSKNQFVTEALLFYISHYGDESFMEQPAADKKYISQDELEKVKEEILQASRMEARNEVIKVLGGVIAGMRQSPAAGTAFPEKEPKAAHSYEDDEVIASCAMGWMMKGDDDG